MFKHLETLNTLIEANRRKNLEIEALREQVAALQGQQPEKTDAPVVKRCPKNSLFRVLAPADVEIVCEHCFGTMV